MEQHATDKNGDVLLPSVYTTPDPVSSNGLLKLRTMGATPPAQANPDLEVLLGQYPTYASIVENLHYTDIKTLLLVSKTIHNAIASTSKSYETLRKSTCVQGTKTECWGCQTQAPNSLARPSKLSGTLTQRCT
ncbi:MAG: hypothetical protein M1830_010420 [Pleopsidium flavum]|nr:MAG: hypothetical protein M1830_010420 [Pleopsidium flavum]